MTRDPNDTSNRRRRYARDGVPAVASVKEEPASKSAGKKRKSSKKS